MPPFHTEIADLLADESFINYCRGTDKEALAKWEAFCNESQANRALADAARERFVEIFNALAQADLEQQEARLSARLFSAGPAPVIPMKALPIRRKFIRNSLKWSALLIPVMSIGFWYYLSGTRVIHFQTAMGERKNFHLPDGSFVRLNAGSTLNLCDDFGTHCRDVYLEGEAYFDVHHNDRTAFIVHTADMDIRAVGTAFNVRAYGGDRETETALLKGIVEVTLKHPQHRRIILRPDQKVQWSLHAKPVPAGKDTTLVSGLVRTSDGDVRETDWINNKLIFDDEPLSDIAVRLERWYGVKVLIEDEELKAYHFTGTFGGENITDVLDICRESRPFSYRIIPGEQTVVRIFK